jgi:hypothetical protein
MIRRQIRGESSVFSAELMYRKEGVSKGRSNAEWMSAGGNGQRWGKMDT